MDHAMASIDQLLLPQPHEHFAHGAGVSVVERETRAVPVRRAADHLELLEDRLARFLDEFPHTRDKGVPTHGKPRLSFVGEDLLNHVLGRDTGVVGAGWPAGGAAAHAPGVDPAVLSGYVEPSAQAEPGGQIS